MRRAGPRRTPHLLLRSPGDASHFEPGLISDTKLAENIAWKPVKRSFMNDYTSRYHSLLHVSSLARLNPGSPLLASVTNVDRPAQ